jgi:hypothetical protein
MKTLLRRKYLGICLALLLTCCADSQVHWNYSLTDTQKAVAIIQLEHIRAEACVPSPVHAVISLVNGQCRIGVGGNTNVVAYRPLHSQAYDAHLFAKDGKEIPKAWFNHEFGQTLKPDKKLLDGSFAMDLDAQYGHSRMLLFPTCSDAHYWDFDVLKSFRIKEAGEYRLEVQVRLFIKDTNADFQPFFLPPVETHVKIPVGEL